MSSKNEDGIMYVTLSSYLQRLQAEEKSKPEEERRRVPTMKKLAEVAGVNSSGLSRIANGYTKSFNFDVCASVISELRRRGFNTEITDIFKFEMPGESKGPLLKPLTRRQRLKEKSKQPMPPPLTREQRRKYPGDEFVKAYAEEEPTPKEEAGVGS